MKIYTVINERYSNEPVKATLADLEQLATKNDWHVEFRETVRDGIDVIIDDRNEVVADSQE